MVNLRISNVAVEPIDKRRLAIWIRPRDLAQLCEVGLDHLDIRSEKFYGASDNHSGWWDNANAETFGYHPQYSSHDFCVAVMAKEPPAATDSPDEIYSGGTSISVKNGGGRPKLETGP